jgi:RimJ/RimL family protein N-acetyltransferase
MNIPTLRTSHLILRPWMAEDAERLVAILQDSDILRYFPCAAPWSREKADWYITHHQSHWQQRGYGHWAVVTSADGQVAGWNGLEFLPETGETEVAYLLSREFWGHGYATEAAQAALNYGFTHCNLDRIIGLTHPANIASQRVLEKCRMAFVDRQFYFGMELCRYQVEREEFSNQGGG